MLIRFRVSNFRSLKDEQELSMVAAFRGGRDDLVPIETLGLDLVRVAGIYGPNAAGKSNVLDALKFMRDAVRRSHREWPPEGPIPREPFLLDRRSEAEPSLFEVDFLMDGTHFQYGFKLDSERILQEWLYAFPHKRRQTWYEREDHQFSFGRQLKGSNRLLESLTRPNSLFLSVAAGNNHQALLPVYSWFAERLRFSNHENRERQLSCTVGLLQEEESSSKPVVDLLRQADLGISGIDVQSDPVPLPRKLTFLHQASGGEVAFPFERESRGTQRLVALAGPILDALANRAVLCIDELDSSLHPHLAYEVIHLFQDPKRNPRNAQLIFNSHDTTLLGNLLEAPGLQRDQVWFVEKDEKGTTHLFPLTDFKPRKFENVERGYLQGRYGAVPFIESTLVNEDA